MEDDPLPGFEDLAISPEEEEELIHPEDLPFSPIEPGPHPRQVVPKGPPTQRKLFPSPRKPPRPIKWGERGSTLVLAHRLADAGLPYIIVSMPKPETEDRDMVAAWLAVGFPSSFPRATRMTAMLTLPSGRTSYLHIILSAEGVPGDLQEFNVLIPTERLGAVSLFHVRQGGDFSAHWEIHTLAGSADAENLPMGLRQMGVILEQEMGDFESDPVPSGVYVFPTTPKMVPVLEARCAECGVEGATKQCVMCKCGPFCEPTEEKHCSCLHWTKNMHHESCYK